MRKIRTNQKMSLTLVLLLALSAAIFPGIMASSQAVAQVREPLKASFGRVPLVATVDVSTLTPPGAPSGTGQILGPMPQANNAVGSSPLTASGPDGPAPLSSTSSSSVTTSSGFEGLIEWQGGGLPVPDVQVAAGPNDVLEMVNVAGGIFSKLGSPKQTFLLPDFYKTGSDFVFDPKVLFDTSSQRWFASLSDGTRDSILVAISNSSSPTGWKVYSVPDDGRFPDQPTIGVSDDKLVVSTNDFTSAVGTTFLGAHYWILNKSNMTSGAPGVSAVSIGPDISLFSVHPVQSLSSTTTQYMVTVGANSTSFHCFDCTKPQLFSITGVPPGTITVSTTPLSILPIFAPPDGVQPGTSNAVNPDDSRVESAAWFQGKLWFGLNDGCLPSGDTKQRSCVRLIQFDTAKSKLKQNFDFGASGQYYFYPALQIDSQGNLDFTYGYSSSTIFPSLAVTGQGVGDRANTLAPSVAIKSGNASDTSGRYGDYFGSGLDSSDPTVVWVAGEYHTTPTGSCKTADSSCWSTFIDSMSFTDFNISASPTALTFSSGSTGTSAITVTSLSGFAGTVTLSSIASPAAGLTVSFSQTTLALTAGGKVTSTATLSSSIPGTYSATVTGTSGSRFHSATLGVKVIGFRVSGSPALVFLSPGSSTTSTITVTSINGFTGTVSLVVVVSPSTTGGPTATLTPSVLTLTSGGSGVSTLTISTVPSTIAGLYTANVTGTSGSQFHSVFIPTSVTPVTVNINNSTSFTGITVSTSGTVSVDSPSISLTLSGTVSVSATNITTGLSLFAKTYTVTRLSISNTSATTYLAIFLLNVAVSPYALSSDLTVTFSGAASSAAVLVTRNLDIDANGVVDQQDLNIVVAALNCSLGMSCYNPRADFNANGVVDFIDASILTVRFGAPNFIPNFNISANPTSLGFTTAAGNTGDASTITVNSINGFAGTVNLSITVFRGGLLDSSLDLRASLNSTSVTLAQGGSAAVSLSVTSKVDNVYTVVVTGISGSLSNAASVTVTVVFCTFCV